MKITSLPGLTPNNDVPKYAVRSSDSYRHLRLEVVSIRETMIGDHHAFVTVEWGARFEKTGDERICFEISYLLRISEGRPLILAYVTHEDQEDVMRARGVI